MAARRLLLVRSQLRLSGTTERLRTSVRALTEDGWEVHVLAGPGVRSREVEEAGATLHAEQVARRGWSAPFVRGRARHLFDRLDATLALVVGQDLAPLAAHLRRPHVLEIDRPPRARLPWSRAHLRGVIAPCATLIEAIVNRGGLPREQLTILAHAPAGDPEARPAFTADGPPRIGVAGGLEAGLGAGALLEAGRTLLDAGHELELVILGEGPAEATVRRHARDLGIQEHVTVTAPAAPSTAALLAQLDVYICPQPEGTPGWLTAEALALGRPALLSANQGSFQWVEDGVDGCLVDRADPSGLAKGLRALLDDPAAARSMGERARARWSAPEPYAQRLREIVEQAVALESP
jgi:glycosyltransferase involved in cell wall biosynthesis